MLQLLAKRLSLIVLFQKACSLYPQDQTADLLQRSFWTERPLPDMNLAGYLHAHS